MWTFACRLTVPGDGRPGGLRSHVSPADRSRRLWQRNRSVRLHRRGSTDLWFAPTAPGKDFFVKMDPPVGTVNFFRELHPGMQGSLQVVADTSSASTADQVEDSARALYFQDTLGAFAAERQVEEHAVSRDEDGRRNVTVTAGTAPNYVEVVEMLPRKIHIEAGDTVKWTTKTIRDVLWGMTELAGATSGIRQRPSGEYEVRFAIDNCGATVLIAPSDKVAALLDGRPASLRDVIALGADTPEGDGVRSFEMSLDAGAVQEALDGAVAPPRGLTTAASMVAKVAAGLASVPSTAWRVSGRPPSLCTSLTSSRPIFQTDNSFSTCARTPLDSTLSDPPTHWAACF